MFSENWCSWKFRLRSFTHQSIHCGPNFRKLFPAQSSAWHSCDRAFVFDVMLILTPQSIFRQTTLDVERTFCTVRSLIHFPLRNNRRRCSESIIIFFSLRLFIFHYLINQQFSWNSICRLIERQEVRRRRIIILAENTAKHNQNCCGANRWSESDFNYFLLLCHCEEGSWTYLSSKLNFHLTKQRAYFVCKESRTEFTQNRGIEFSVKDCKFSLLTLALRSVLEGENLRAPDDTIEAGVL